MIGNSMPLKAAETELKFGQEFRGRLAGMEQGATARAILLLRVPERGSLTRRGNAQDRQEALRFVQEAAEASIAGIDAVLRRFGGSRLSEQPTAAGSLAVETTPEGLRALAELDAVRAVLEDQPLVLPPGL